MQKQALEAARDRGETPQVLPLDGLTALIDTGADVSVVPEGIAQSLGIQATGFVNVRNPFASGVTSAALYAVSIKLGVGGYWLRPVDVRVAGASASEILIGRDIIERGDLFWSGHEGTFTMSLPL